MTTDKRPALDLRHAITDIYTGESPPPGAERANGILFMLRREPESETQQHRARDLLAVVDLRARLLDHRERAERAGAHNLALVVHGLIGHADAELLGSTRDPGWRAAALDILDPDGESDGDGDADPVDDETARRLFALALGLGGDETADDAAGD